MPKVTRKETDGPLVAVPSTSGMDTDEPLPQKPDFTALAADGSQGPKKIEIRRVRSGHEDVLHLSPLMCWTTGGVYV
jgi:hypothetical protein